ncbi:RNA polymerase sigma-54 factor, partial [Rubneribacter badeniensis]
SAASVRLNPAATASTASSLVSNGYMRTPIRTPECPTFCPHPRLIEKDMKTHLRAQMPSGVGSDVVVESVIDTLDEDGYFRGEVAAIAFECDVEEPDVRLVLDAVRSAEPAGVGATDLIDCLKLQVARLPSPHGRVAYALLDRFPHDFFKERPGSLARCLGVSRADVIAAMEAIRKCDPCPGRAFTKEAIAYTHPDIIIERREGKWSVSVFGATTCPLTLNESYLALLGSKVDDETREYLEGKKREAKNVLRNLDYRGRMLYRLGLYLLEKEYEFMNREGEGLVALSMRRVADAIGVHETTISRIVNLKSLQTPFGVYPLRMFFGSSLDCVAAEGACDEGSVASTVSSFDVKRMLSNLISEERREKPLSDQALADELVSRGVSISRRTVAKYRESLGIPSSPQRKHR